MTKQQAKRVIKELDFSQENNGIALVGPAVGGPANARQTLQMKGVSSEVIKKASEVQVTMGITEFLTRMFGMWECDAEILARALGYTTEEMDEMQKEGPEDWNSWIEQQVASIQVMKSLKESGNVEEALMQVPEDDFLQLKLDQEKIEKAFIKAEEIKKQAAVNPVAESPEMQALKKSVLQAEASLAVSNAKLQKAEADLQVALAEVAEFRKQKEQEVTKQKQDRLLKSVGGNTEQMLSLYSVFKHASDEEFEAACVALQAVQKAAQEADMYKQVSLQAKETSPGEEESSLTRLIKATYHKETK